MAFTVEDRDALKSAIARGVRKVRMGDEEVEYRSQSEMVRALGMIEAELSGRSASSVTVSYPKASRGL